MGSKIPTARLSSGKLISIMGYEAKPQGKVRCAISGCSAELIFVHRHPRKCAMKTIEIPPCFRLKPHETHAEDCKYNISGALSIIAKKSESEVFKAISEKKYEFRLHILIKALRELSNIEVEMKSQGWGSNAESNKSFSNRGKLSNYLRTLKQIIELRTLCENDNELKSLVILKFKDKKIPWSKFFFDNTNLQNFIKYYGSEKYTQPLAISGVVYRINEPVNDYPYHVVELHAPFVQPDSKGVIRRTVVQVVVKNPTVLKSLSINTEYVFFGQWSVNIKESKKKVGQRNNSMIYQNIKMYITNSDHFVAC
ncbi:MULTISPECIES: hypothetical protein [Aliivibrio]|uniref:Uncharacterized protein n=1 Tax=Aliivibrio finisterrensis TaxID=511998 RepID=A0A4Q5KKD8_9GAMM|nr:MULTISPECIES: hypothetical protein [Aliivibrio]MDD9180663.1 hypothetical protein [Aliivibrio sp. A6]RYU46799.1 hypothetical protein ERW57_19005 [Aliivibrio finisterrensis]RYU47463.1 hypothetical protein ERW56_19230 [Aliivibrio finisterrensis]RYU52839.1 hypothetical protein ERW50_18940 [Aliivibrio finisterrensis]RYU78666.1 hypothetical protein ERW55_18935 [Aliivibrio finisterrensis]